MSNASDFHALVLQLQEAGRVLGQSTGSVAEVEAQILAAEAARAGVLRAIANGEGEAVDLAALNLEVRSAGALGACDGAIMAGRRVLKHLGIGANASGVQRGLARAEKLAGGATAEGVAAGLVMAVSNTVLALQAGRDGAGLPLAGLNSAVELAQAYLRVHRDIHPVDMTAGDLDILVAADFVLVTSSAALAPLSAACRVLRYLKCAGVRVDSYCADVADWKNLIQDDAGVVTAMEALDAARCKLSGDGRRNADWHIDVIVLRALNESMLWFLREHRHLRPDDDNAICLDLRIHGGNGGEYFGPLVAASEILRFLAKIPGRGFPDLLDKNSSDRQ